MTGALPRLIHQIRSRVRPPLTLGAQLMVIDQQRRVLLVKPRYAPSWQFPGGGVDRGETAKAAALRETKEETGLAVAGEPVLFGFYFNKAMNQRDHVALFLCERHPTVDEAKLRRPTAEIAAVCVASLDALPADTAVGAQRRIAELAGAPKSEFW